MPEKLKNYFEDNMKLIDLLNPKYTQCIGITGGEPTLNIKELGIILAKCKKKFNNSSIHVLTNGRAFKDKDKVKELTTIYNSNITYGVPLYSDNSDEHDYIVGVKGSFNQTIRGLYNLAKENQMIEIRIVVLKQNYKKLKDIAEFIYRNLPFVVHVAIMSMEYIGTAEENFDNIFIDPIDYKDELLKAVQEFVRYDMNVSIYNTPLCLLDENLWEYAKDSISEWKKTYVAQCNNCLKRECCSGVFATSFRHSENILPICEEASL
jgi:His-Xaa-Ser system radical SAM maturase HxsC